MLSLFFIQKYQIKGKTFPIQAATVSLAVSFGTRGRRLVSSSAYLSCHMDKQLNSAWHLSTHQHDKRMGTIFGEKCFAESALLSVLLRPRSNRSLLRRSKFNEIVNPTITQIYYCVVSSKCVEEEAAVQILQKLPSRSCIHVSSLEYGLVSWLRGCSGNCRTDSNWPAASSRHLHKRYGDMTFFFFICYFCHNNLLFYCN